jgi:methyl-accepting chemotaxis protein
MSKLKDIPIRIKLMMVTVLASAIALLLAGSIIVAYENLTYRDQKVKEIAVQSQILAESVAASLEFSDPKSAQEYLNALRANSEIYTAGVYDMQGTLFASYVRPETITPPVPTIAKPPGQYFDGDQLAVSSTITQGVRNVGTVYLRVYVEPLAARVARYGGIILLVMIGSLLITLPISMRLHSTIANSIHEIAKAVSGIAAGDLTVKMSQETRKDELGVLSTKISQMTENLRTQISGLTDGANVLGMAANKIVASTAQLAASTSESAAAVSETATTVDEVRQTAEVASQKARLVSESSQKAAQSSQNGRKSIEDVSAGMERIRQQMDAIATSMGRLSEQSQAIGQIMASVEDLAAQSKLLAVNAAIEAAKAGEHGKGFGVVAQEVRSLAEQSRQATNQVRTILGDIQKATTTAVMATEQGSKAVEAGTRQTEIAGESIQALAGSVMESAQAATQIAASSQQQLIGIDQVASAMDSIKQASTQNVASAQQLEAAAGNLNDLGQRLKQMVERYEV